MELSFDTAVPILGYKKESTRKLHSLSTRYKDMYTWYVTFT